MELEAATRNLIGFAKCLLAMKQEILRNESSHIDPSFNQNAGRRIEPEAQHRAIGFFDYAERKGLEVIKPLKSSKAQLMANASNLWK